MRLCGGRALISEIYCCRGRKIQRCSGKNSLRRHIPMTDQCCCQRHGKWLIHETSALDLINRIRSSASCTDRGVSCTPDIMHFYGFFHISSTSSTFNPIPRICHHAFEYSIFNAIPTTAITRVLKTSQHSRTLHGTTRERSTKMISLPHHSFALTMHMFATVPAARLLPSEPVCTSPRLTSHWQRGSQPDCSRKPILSFYFLAVVWRSKNRQWKMR